MQRRTLRDFRERLSLTVIDFFHTPRANGKRLVLSVHEKLLPERGSRGSTQRCSEADTVLRCDKRSSRLLDEGTASTGFARDPEAADPCRGTGGVTFGVAASVYDATATRCRTPLATAGGSAPARPEGRATPRAPHSPRRSKQLPETDATRRLAIG